MSSKPTIGQEPTAKRRSCVAQALLLLGRKSLADAALKEALVALHYPQDEIAAAMAQVRTWGYVNDDRLGDAVVAAAIRQKKGPAWVRQQCHRRDVPHEVASRCLSALADEAHALACALLESKFNPQALAEPRTAQRAMRLLLRRGFDLTTSQAALKAQGGSTACVASRRGFGQAHDGD